MPAVQRAGRPDQWLVSEFDSGAFCSKALKNMVSRLIGEVDFQNLRVVARAGVKNHDQLSDGTLAGDITNAFRLFPDCGVMIFFMAEV